MGARLPLPITPLQHPLRNKIDLQTQLQNDLQLKSLRTTSQTMATVEPPEPDDCLHQVRDQGEVVPGGRVLQSVNVLGSQGERVAAHAGDQEIRQINGQSCGVPTLKLTNSRQFEHFPVIFDGFGSYLVPIN